MINHGLYDDRKHYSLRDNLRFDDRDLVINPNLLHHVRNQDGLFHAMRGAMSDQTEPISSTRRSVTFMSVLATTCGTPMAYEIDWSARG